MRCGRWTCGSGYGTDSANGSCGAGEMKDRDSYRLELLERSLDELLQRLAVLENGKEHDRVTGRQIAVHKERLDGLSTKVDACETRELKNFAFVLASFQKQKDRLDGLVSELGG